MNLIKCGICSECGDTFLLPSDLEANSKLKCLRCKKEYSLKVVQMYDFVFKALKSVKGA